MGVVCLYLAITNQGSVFHQAQLDSEEEVRAVTTGYMAWKKHTSKALDELQLPVSFEGWTGRAQYRGPKAPRVKAVLKIGWARRMVQHRKKGDQADATLEILARGYFADVSQSVERNPFTDGHLKTLTQRSSTYSYEGDCVFSAEDHLKTLGFSDAHTRSTGMSQGELKSLSGEAFSMPCVSLCFFMFYMNPYSPWWPLQKHPSLS